MGLKNSDTFEPQQMAEIATGQQDPCMGGGRGSGSTSLSAVWLDAPSTPSFGTGWMDARQVICSSHYREAAVGP